MRIVFMGTPEFSVPVLRALHGAGHDIVACYSQPPRPAGRRGLELKPSPVHLAADELGIAVYTPKSLKSEEEQSIFAGHKADVAVVVAYGLILPKAILDAPEHGCYNGHASLLPRWRGAAPIQRAIMAGDTETGMMIMKMDVGLDTGPIALQERIAISPNTTAGGLHDALSEVGAKLMVQAMAKLEAGNLPLSAQNEDGMIYAEKISKSEARIDWNQPAQELHQIIMGLSPFPGAWCEMPLGDKSVRVKILNSAIIADRAGNAGQVLDEQMTIACAEGAIELLRLQKAGSKPMDRDDFLRGNNLKPGTQLDGAK